MAVRIEEAYLLVHHLATAFRKSDTAIRLSWLSSTKCAHRSNQKRVSQAYKVFEASSCARVHGMQTGMSALATEIDTALGDTL